MSRTQNIDQLLDEVITLPSLPTTVARVAELVNDPEMSIAEVGKAISLDPSIAMKTLRLVNSAYYGVREKIDSVEQAVILLGMKVMKNLVVTATVFETFNAGGERFMRHSVACGNAIRIITEETVEGGQEHGDDAFVQGLLHDVGKVILEEHMHDQYEKIGAIARGEGISWHKAERQVIGVDHAELGARLAKKWRLSDNLVNAIAGHHDLSVCPDGPSAVAAANLAVANYICYSSGLYGHVNVVLDVDDAVWEKTTVTSQSLPEIMARFYESLPQVEELVTMAA